MAKVTMKNTRQKLGRAILSSVLILLFLITLAINSIEIGINNGDTTWGEKNYIEPPTYSPPLPTRSRADTDGDGLTDDKEVIFVTDPNDPDSDDDGVLDGDEELNILQPSDPDNDPDGDGWNNAKDADSDGDGILDGTEKGLTDANINLSATDISKGHFQADMDPTTTTDMTNDDTDGDSIKDGDEDANSNGKYEPSRGETDPNFKDFDNDGIHGDEDEDDDNDGMPDEFEKKYGLNPLDASDKNGDMDNDGFTNYREYLGNDNAEGNDDWSNPNDPTSMPNIAPVVLFKSSDEVVVGGEKIKRASVEAKQKLVFNDTLLKVTDENAKAGLDYKWDFGEGEDVYTQHNVKPQDAPLAHTYDVAGVYTVTLQVVDDINNVGEAKLIVDVTAPIGVSGKVIDIKKEQTEFNEKNTIQRTGWIAYKFVDVQRGEKIIIEFEVYSKQGIEDLGIRVFVIPEKNFKVYQENKPTTKVISREYEEYWSGLVSETKSSGKIEIEPEEDETLIVIFDNRYYDEGKTHLSIDEPVEYTVTAKRELTSAYWIENWLIPILGAVALVICILIVVYFYTKIRRETLLENKIRAKILNYILKNPGMHYRKILTDLNLNMGVLTHHLNMLEQQEFLKSYNDHMYRRYYPPNIRMNPAATLSPPQANVLQTIRNSPGISQVGIARNLNQDRKVVHYHVKRLSNEGLVHVEPNGRESKCYFVDNQS